MLPPNFIRKLLQEFKQVQLPEFQPQIEKRNYETLKPYLPKCTWGYTRKLLKHHNVNINVVGHRNSKLGDYKPVPKGQTPRITLNSTLNPYSFLITFLHEWGHLLIDEKHGRKVKPHGYEWKYVYQTLLIPLLDIKELPEEFRRVTVNHARSPKASALGDPILAKYLKQFDNYQGLHLEDLPAKTLFTLNGGLILEKGERRRTRFMCQDPKTKKKYTVHALAEVEIYKS